MAVMSVMAFMAVMVINILWSYTHSAIFHWNPLCQTFLHGESPNLEHASWYFGGRSPKKARRFLTNSWGLDVENVANWSAVQKAFVCHVWHLKTCVKHMNVSGNREKKTVLKREIDDNLLDWVFPYSPWCWNMCQHLHHKTPSFEGTSTMLWDCEFH